MLQAGGEAGLSAKCSGLLPASQRRRYQRGQAAVGCQGDPGARGRNAARASACQARGVSFPRTQQADSNALVALLYEKPKQERISCWQAVQVRKCARWEACAGRWTSREDSESTRSACSRYFARPWCLFELKCAQELGKPVMCIRLDDARQAAITHMQVMESENWLLEQGILKTKLSKHNIEKVPDLKYVDQFVKDLVSRIVGTRQGQQGKVQVEQKTSPPAASAKTTASSKRPALPTESHSYRGGQYVGEWQNGRPEGRGDVILVVSHVLVSAGKKERPLPFPLVILEVSHVLVSVGKEERPLPFPLVILEVSHVLVSVGKEERPVRRQTRTCPAPP
eukprot:g78751.t1